MAMDRYLYTHYKGKYRVLPELDMDTLDFPRDDEGNIDDDYSDFFMKGKSGIKITHGIGSELACYIPSSGVGYNVVRDYCKLMLGKTYQSYEKAADELMQAKYINDIDFLDGEVWFSFDAKWLDDLNKIVKLRTSGASISPLSSRNLPTTPYSIPEKDMGDYKTAKEGIEPLALGRFNTKFGNENWGDEYNGLLRASHLKAIHFFHKEGKWNEYIEYIKGVDR